MQTKERKGGTKGEVAVNRCFFEGGASVVKEIKRAGFYSVQIHKLIACRSVGTEVDATVDDARDHPAKRQAEKLGSAAGKPGVSTLPLATALHR